MAEGITELTSSNFSTEVEQASVPVLVDFWAPWCGPCRMLAPLLEEIAQESEGKFKIAKVDIDANQELAVRYNVRSIPTLLLFKGGEVKETVVGANTPKAVLVDKLTALI